MIIETLVSQVRSVGDESWFDANSALRFHQKKVSPFDFFLVS